jgi:dTDP-glucose pyrophosphorylase/CBS domain-containing protein
MMPCQELLIHPELSLEAAMRQLDRTGRGVLFIVDAEERLLATITDGDIRRALLSGNQLTASVRNIVDAKAGRRPVTASVTASAEEIRRLMADRAVRQIPLLDSSGRVGGFVTLDDILADTPSMEAVIMAGGFGKRLHPLTHDTPKPMLQVGDRPLLEHTVEQMKNAGIETVHITTHFAAEKIRGHFGDGGRMGISVNYVEEDKPLGTAGALSALRNSKSRLLVINGDILTGVDFTQLQRFHVEHGALLTVGLRQYDFEVPYGVVECEGAEVRAVREKPRYEFFVNAGIYLVEPAALEFIPEAEVFHMTDLITALTAAGRSVAGFPIVEYWLDIGLPADYEQAQRDVKEGKIKS